MATVTKLGVDHRVRLGATPWGNRSALRYPLQTNSSGALVNGDSPAAIASGDVVRIGLIPAGFRIYDSQVVVATAMTALVTGNLGFQYADGVDDANVPQSATAFGTALALNTAGRLRNATTGKSFVLPKDAWLILTTGGADNAKVSDIEITLEATAEGV